MYGLTKFAMALNQPEVRAPRTIFFGLIISSSNYYTMYAFAFKMDRALTHIAQHLPDGFTSAARPAAA
jgi:hypothetical protein